MESMAEMRKTYRVQRSELLLAYLLHVNEKGEEPGVFSAFDLSGASVKGLKAVGTDEGKVDWRNGRFEGANLTGSDFRGIDFSGSCFDNAILDNCVFDHCVIDLVEGKSVSLVGTIFHDCDARSAYFSQPAVYRCEWLRSGEKDRRFKDSGFNGSGRKIGREIGAGKKSNPIPPPPPSLQLF